MTTRKEPAETSMSARNGTAWEASAQEFGRYASGWRLRFLAASCAENVGRGANPQMRIKVPGKVPAETFAQRAGVSGDTVLRALAQWVDAYNQGAPIPYIEDLVPGARQDIRPCPSRGLGRGASRRATGARTRGPAVHPGPEDRRLDYREGPRPDQDQRPVRSAMPDAGRNADRGSGGRHHPGARVLRRKERHLMAATKAVQKAAAESTDGSWRTCPPELGGCGHERRVSLGVLIDHRRWDSWNREMVDCAGSGQPPSQEPVA